VQLYSSRCVTIAAAKQMHMTDGRTTGFMKQLGITSKVLGLYIHDKFLEYGIDLSRQQFVLLKILSVQGNRCQNDLAFITERDKTSMTRLVSVLEKKGLVKRIPDKSDMRKRIISLTEEGAKTLDLACPIMEDIEYKVTEDLEPNELQSFIKILIKIQTKVLDAEGVEQ
jgi:DNA-binding MarR family transcriptional regulator